MSLEKVVYTAKAKATGGRDGRASCLRLATPPASSVR